MKIIITESQYRLIIEETTNPCPEGVKENELITLEQVKLGSTISKGYCNSSENSAIVQIQKMLQTKNLLDTKSYNGYYGDKTVSAVKKLWEPSVVEGTIIGKKTVEKLETTEVTPKTNTTTPTKNTTISSETVKKDEALRLFNGLTKNQKIIVCTLLGEAGGETDPVKGMTAVANVLKNRADSNHRNAGSTVADQALARKQFSMWNNYNDGAETLQSVYNKYNTHSQMKNAISIVNSIDTLADITGGAQYYYASYVRPDWSQDTDTTRWVPTTTIGGHKFGNVEKKKKKKS